MTALEREWSAKLRASGFRDLEGRDRDGPLSDRGNLHVVTEGDGQQERLAERIEHGSAYNTWAMHVLHTHRFASRLEREAWGHHARGEGLRDAARSLDCTYHDARDAVNAVKARVKRQGDQGEEQICEKPTNLRKLVRRSDSGTLLKLAQVLIQARPA